MLCWLKSRSGHMTDTGECEGQRGWLVPAVRQREGLPLFLPLLLLSTTQTHCVHSVGTETPRVFFPATARNLNPNLNHNRLVRESIWQEHYSLRPALSEKKVLCRTINGFFRSFPFSPPKYSEETIPSIKDLSSAQKVKNSSFLRLSHALCILNIFYHILPLPYQRHIICFHVFLLYSLCSHLFHCTFFP